MKFMIILSLLFALLINLSAQAPTYLDGNSEPASSDGRITLLHRIAGGIFNAIVEVSGTAAMPDYLTPIGSEPQRGDSEIALLHRIAGGVHDLQESIGGGGGSAPDYSARKVIIVSKGTAATDTRTDLSPYDVGKPFATLSAAHSAAVAGDLIVVEPGTYLYSGTNGNKNGVNWYFHRGAEIVVSVDSSGFGNPSIWKAVTGVSYGVYGYGRFANTHAAGGVVNTAAGSSVEIHGRIEAGTTGIATSGRVKFVGEIVAGTRGVTVSNNATTDLILTGRITAGAGHSPVLFAGSSAAPKCRLENVVLIAADGTTASVATTTGTPSVKVYQALANTAVGAGVAQTVGTVLVDANVD